MVDGCQLGIIHYRVDAIHDVRRIYNRESHCQLRLESLMNVLCPSSLWISPRFAGDGSNAHNLVRMSPWSLCNPNEAGSAHVDL